MGHAHHQQSNSSGAVVAIVAFFLIAGVLTVIAVAGTLFWARAASMQSRAVAVEQLAMADARHAETIVQMQLQQQSNRLQTPGPQLDFEVKIDREGNATVAGKEMDLDELSTQLAKLKEETSNAFLVLISADPECPISHVVPVLDVCEAVGDIDFRITSPDGVSAAKESADN